MLHSSTAMARVSRYAVAVVVFALLTSIALSAFFKPAVQHTPSPSGVASFAAQGSGSGSPSPASSAPLRSTQSPPDASQFSVAISAEQDKSDTVASSESAKDPNESDDFDYVTQLQFEEKYLQQASSYEQANDAGFGAPPGNLLDIEGKDEITSASAEQRRNEQSYLEYTFLYEQAAESGVPMLTAAPPLDVLANTHDQALYQEQQEAESRYAEWIDASANDPQFYFQNIELQATDSGISDVADRPDASQTDNKDVETLPPGTD